MPMQPTAVRQPEDQKYCLKANYIGDACQIQRQCSTNLYSSFCIEGQCGCAFPQVPAEDNLRCVDKKDYCRIIYVNKILKQLINSSP